MGEDLTDKLNDRDLAELSKIFLVIMIASFLLGLAIGTLLI